MERPFLRMLCSLLVAGLAAGRAAGTTYVMVPDATLVSQAEVIAEVEVLGSAAAEEHSLPATDYRAAVIRLLKGEDKLTTYTFNTRLAKHRFCSICGIKSFYVPRSFPEGFSVNVRCLDDGAVTVTRIGVFDGAHWEEAQAQRAARPDWVGS